MSEWRRRIFEMKENEILEINYKNLLQLPNYIRDDIVINELTFCVKTVKNCLEEFDKGLIIFKFWSKEYTDVCSYSGNNPNVL